MVTNEARAEALAKHIIKNLPDQFRASFGEWDQVRRSITSLIKHDLDKPQQQAEEDGARA